MCTDNDDGDPRGGGAQHASAGYGYGGKRFGPGVVSSVAEFESAFPGGFRRNFEIADVAAILGILADVVEFLPL